MNISRLNYDSQTRRLALGIEFEDILRDMLPVYPLRAEIETQVPHSAPLPAKVYSFAQVSTMAPAGLARHASGRYSLSYFPGITEHIDCRFYDYYRYYLPRRLRIPLLTLAAVQAIENNEEANYLNGRMRNVILFPGAAYHCQVQATGLRGQVMRGGVPMRWAYVSARLPGQSTVISRTRSDDRGEFLLILPPEAAPASDLTASLPIDISIAGPATLPTPDTPAQAEQDPWWDLPLEQLPAIGEVDDVSSGEAIPTGYVTALSTVRTVECLIGRLLTGTEVVDFDFVMP